MNPPQYGNRIYLISQSKVIISIYEDCKIQIPPYVTEVSYADYFGHNSLTQSVKGKNYSLNGLTIAKLSGIAQAKSA